MQGDRHRRGEEGDHAKCRKESPGSGQDPGNAGFEDVGPEVRQIQEKPRRAGMKKTPPP